MKKITFFSLVTFFVLLFSTTVGYSQGIEIMAPSEYITTGATASCTASDVEIGRVYLGYDDKSPATCPTNGNPVYIWIDLTKASSKYGLYVEFALIVDGVQVNLDLTPSSDIIAVKQVNVSSTESTLIDATKDYRVKESLPFTCGASFELRDIYISWGTKNVLSGQNGGPACNSEVPSIFVEGPLVTDFTYTRNCNVVTVTTDMTGGRLYGASVLDPIETPYNITIDYGDGSLAMTVTPNPDIYDNASKEFIDYVFSSHSYPVNNTASPITYTITLTATDTATPRDSDTKTYDIIVNPLLTARTTKVDVLCKGDATGTATVIPADGTSGYTYLWDTTPAQNTATASGLIAGTYNVTVTDANGCTATTTATINAAPAAITLAATPTQIVCFGGLGSVVLSSDGLAPFTYGGDATTGLVAGTYTYTVTDANGCTATVAVTITEPAAPDAGTNGALSICPLATVTATQLFAALSGSPDGGGTWSPALAGAGTYTYTVTAIAPCTIAATAAIVVTESGVPDAGTDGALTICVGSTVTAAQLFGQLGGSPDGGGTWSPTLAGAGTYSYTVTTPAPCANIATTDVVVTEQVAPNAGTNGTLSICPLTTVTAAQLFGALNGTPDISGTWSPALTGAGTYTYTVTAIAPCTVAATAAIVVTESGVPDAGTNGALSICPLTTVTAAQLFGALNGTPDISGIWSPALAGGGTYTYTVTTLAPCANVATTDVVVTEQVAPDAGTDGALTICAGSTVTAAQLFGQLGGSPDGSGTWSPTLAGAGTYSYTVTTPAPCTVAAKAIIVVTVSNITPSFDANSFAFTAYETYVVNDEIKFYNLSTGAAIAVLWDFGDGSTSSEFEPSLTYTEIGTYTVTLTITDQFGCIYSYYEDIEITKGYDIIVPNQFTPNGDGINDNFRPVYFGIVTTLMEVYDTWGGMVYWEEGNILEGWNGLIKNKEAENGNYFYRIIAQPFNTSSPIKLSGSFNLSK